MSTSQIPHLAGRLITFEGGDGTGKSTQLAILRQRLVEEGVDVAVFDFPHKNGTPIGSLIGKFLLGDFREVPPEFLALSFSLDRFDTLGQIVECQRQNRIILIDRYVRSNLVFQGTKISNTQRRAEFEKLITWVEFELLRLPKPDVEIILSANDKFFRSDSHVARTVDPSRSYIGGETDIHEGNRKLQVAVDRYYRSIPQSSRTLQISILDSRGDRLSPASVHERIWAALECA